jgi:hypothetical protein
MDCDPRIDPGFELRYRLPPVGGRYAASDHAALPSTDWPNSRRRSGPAEPCSTFSTLLQEEQDELAAGAKSVADGTSPASFLNRGRRSDCRRKRSWEGMDLPETTRSAACFGFTCWLRLRVRPSCLGAPDISSSVKESGGARTGPVGHLRKSTAGIKVHAYGFYDFTDVVKDPQTSQEG